VASRREAAAGREPRGRPKAGRARKITGSRRWSEAKVAVDHRVVDRALNVGELRVPPAAPERPRPAIDRAATEREIVVHASRLQRSSACGAPSENRLSLTKAARAPFEQNVMGTDCPRGLHIIRDWWADVPVASCASFQLAFPAPQIPGIGRRTRSPSSLSKAVSRVDDPYGTRGGNEDRA